MQMETVDKNCACKGIRKCAMCAPFLVEHEKNEEEYLLQNSKKKYFIFCLKCHQAVPLNKEKLIEVEKFIKSKENATNRLLECECNQLDASNVIKLNGITLMSNFLSSAEEELFLCEMNKSEWVSSQSGRFKQDYGPKANFNKKKLNITKFTGLPSYSQLILDRLNSLKLRELEYFYPAELCNLKYESNRGSCIDPHFDDFWLWGNRIVIVSLLSNTFYTLTPGKEILHLFPECEILVPLERFSMIILYDDARNKWMHSIKKSHVYSTRIAITVRELSDEFKLPKETGVLGKQIERLALSFKGMSTGSLEKILGSSNKSSENFQKSSNFELDDNILKSLERRIDLNSYVTLKNSPTKLVLVSKNLEFKIKKYETALEKVIFQRFTKIKNQHFTEFQKNAHIFEFIEDLNGLSSICIREIADTAKEISLDCIYDETMLFYIGMQISKWREFSSQVILKFW